MFDWVLNTPLPLDGYYLHVLSSLYVHIVAPNVVQDCSFKEFFIFQILFFFEPKYFYEVVF